MSADRSRETKPIKASKPTILRQMMGELNLSGPLASLMKNTVLKKNSLVNFPASERTENAPYGYENYLPCYFDQSGLCVTVGVSFSQTTFKESVDSSNLIQFGTSSQTVHFELNINRVNAVPLTCQLQIHSGRVGWSETGYAQFKISDNHIWHEISTLRDQLHYKDEMQGIRYKFEPMRMPFDTHGLSFDAPGLNGSLMEGEALVTNVLPLPKNKCAKRTQQADGILNFFNSDRFQQDAYNEILFKFCDQAEELCFKNWERLQQNYEFYIRPMMLQGVSTVSDYSPHTVYEP